MEVVVCFPPTQDFMGSFSGQTGPSLHILFCRFSMKYPDNSVCLLSGVVLQKLTTSPNGRN